MVDNNYKIVTLQVGSGTYELYDLEKDPGETTDLFADEPEAANRMRQAFEAWSSQVEASFAGADYPGRDGRRQPPGPPPLVGSQRRTARTSTNGRSAPSTPERLKRALP